MPKAGIHPTYHNQAVVSCSCGATYTVGSTKDSLKVDICRECHPFYSGNQKLIDTAGRVDRFREKVAAAQAMQGKTKPAKVVEPEVKAEIEETPAEETPAEDVKEQE